MEAVNKKQTKKQKPREQSLDDAAASLGFRYGIPLAMPFTSDWLYDRWGHRKF